MTLLSFVITVFCLNLQEIAVQNENSGGDGDGANTQKGVGILAVLLLGMIAILL